MRKYEIKAQGIKSNTEKTSAIAIISYEIENARFNGLSHERIIEQLSGLVDDHQFPSHLVYIDSFYDEQTSLSGVAFQDSYTGKLTIGFAGTNFENGVEASWLDIKADISIAFNGDMPGDPYFKAGDEFIEKLKMAGYTIDMITGHSKGGRDGIVLGMMHQIPQMIVYNSAPLNNLGGAMIANQVQSIKKMKRMGNIGMMQQLVNNYTGILIQIVSEKDPLNQYARLFHSLYPGKTILLKNGGGHDMHQFLGKEMQQLLKEELSQVDGLFPDQIEWVRQQMNKELAELKKVKKKLLTGSQGKLTAPQKIYLEASEALQLVQKMGSILQEELLEWQAMLQGAIREAEQLWRFTISEATILGSLLTPGECEESLACGGATSQMILLAPTTDYEIALQRVRAICLSYEQLIERIQQVIVQQIETDYQLAQVLGN